MGPEEIQKPLKSTNLMECGVSEWDSEYVNIEQEVLFELILAANYLDIKSLLDLTCAKVASMKGQKHGRDPETVQHRQRLHARGGGASPRGEPMVRGRVSLGQFRACSYSGPRRAYRELPTAGPHTEPPL